MRKGPYRVEHGAGYDVEVLPTYDEYVIIDGNEDVFLAGLPKRYADEVCAVLNKKPVAEGGFPQ